nr:MAG TPA: hypothetical protein [Caudoviricetes sp.]
MRLAHYRRISWHSCFHFLLWWRISNYFHYSGVTRTCQRFLID